MPNLIPSGSITLDHLKPEQFEELCLDLLSDLGFTDISWRKGTGRAGSPADGARDIECAYERTAPDGSILRERWIVECKHHTAGVPATALEPTLAAAMALRPDHVLFVCSGFLSNPGKDFLANYSASNRAPFRISVWERPKVNELLRARSRLLIKYGLTFDLLFLEQLHPFHALFIREPPLNTEAYLWQTLDRLPSELRDECLNVTYMWILRPRFRRPHTQYETMAELLVDRVDYPAFKIRCTDSDLAGPFLVRAVVCFTLDWLFCQADETRMDYVRANHQGFVDYLNSELADGTIDDEKRDMLTSLVGKVRQSLAEVPARRGKARELYEFFCERVVAELLLE